ncbi:hypothetical protein KL921_003227 [Ogataea angusta]|nr:hypothetical protein KL921_003227 [Ogataea angusta]
MPTARLDKAICALARYGARAAWGKHRSSAAVAVSDARQGGQINKSSCLVYFFSTATMAIAPRYAKSHVYNGPAGLSSGLKHTVQLYLDYNCPFSGKLFRKITGEVVPLLEKKSLLDKFSFVFMNVIQPWHYVGSGAYHEVALAVAKVYPDQFWKFSGVLWDNIMTDSLSYDKTKKQVLATAIDLAAQHLDNVDTEKLWEQVAVPEGGQNQLQKDIKYFTRYHRTVGVHVTPTVFVDGIVVGSIESSTEPEKIVEILQSLLD